MRINILKYWGTSSTCGCFAHVFVYADKEKARARLNELFNEDMNEYEEDFVNSHKNDDYADFQCGDDFYYYEIEEFVL